MLKTRYSSVALLAGLALTVGALALQPHVVRAETSIADITTATPTPTPAVTATPTFSTPATTAVPTASPTPTALPNTGSLPGYWSAGAAIFLIGLSISQLRRRS